MIGDSGRDPKKAVKLSPERQRTIIAEDHKTSIRKPERKQTFSA